MADGLQRAALSDACAEEIHRTVPWFGARRQVYAAMISAVDDGIGEIPETLRRNGQLENTLIFYIADNGETTEPRAGLNGKRATAGDNGIFRGFN
jgi:arylsulfatase A-like enzyme